MLGHSYLMLLGTAPFPVPSSGKCAPEGMKPSPMATARVKAVAIGKWIKQRGGRVPGPQQVTQEELRGFKIHLHWAGFRFALNSSFVAASFSLDVVRFYSEFFKEASWCS